MEKAAFTLPNPRFVALLCGLFFLLLSTGAYANPQLTLNKTHEPGPIGLGLPVTYVITLSNSGDPNTHVSVTDTLPSGFVFVSAACTASAGAACPGGVLLPPTFGEFNLPTGGNVEIRLTGYFRTGGSKTNLAVASAEDDQGNPLPVGNANTSQDSVTVPFNTFPVDLKVEKCVGPNSGCVISNTVSFPAQLHYQITVTNNTAQSVYLGGILTVRDVLTNSSSIPITFSTSSYLCTPSGGAVCPDLPSAPPAGTLPSSNSTSITFPYDATGAPTTNDTGFLPGNASFKIEFDLDVNTTATCKNGSVILRNRAFLDLSNGSQSNNDPNPADNSSQLVNTTINTSLPDCPPPTPSVQVNKVQTNPPGNVGNWNAPITFQLTVTNPVGGTPLVNFPLTDRIFKAAGTPNFTATVTAGPSCVSGCSSLANVTLLSPTVSSDSDFPVLWTATLAALAGGQAAVIEYTVTYVPVCETDARADRIFNYFQGGSTASQTHTNLPEAANCALQVAKTAQTTGPILFEQPFDYQIVFTNLSAATIDIGTVRDVISLSSNRYGNLPFYYSVSCAATSGTIVSLTPPTPGTITPLPGSKTLTGAIASFRSFGWQGVRLLDEALRFSPGAVLTCQVSDTAHQPSDDNPFCQGAGNPQLVNSAYMDVSRNYDDNGSIQPIFYSSHAAALPLCRNLIVSKTATAQNFGPGATVVYTIAVENKGDDPVGSFTLTDVVQPPLTPVSVGPCAPPAACTAGPTLSGNQVDVQYGLLQRNQPVTFTLTVTAPQAGGSYPNLAQGSFLPGGNFYFQGDEEHFLQQEENIQVLTPALTKSFSPGSIAPNGTATLSFTVTNTNSDPLQTGISFSDTLPTGLRVDSVVTNGCGGTATLSADSRTFSLAGGQLALGQHSCQITIVVRATGLCGIFPNNSSNFSSVLNLDVSAIDEQLEVAGCQEVDIPTLSEWGLLALTAILGTLAMIRLRRGRGLS